MKRFRGIISRKGPAVLAAAVLLAVWQLADSLGLVPGYLLPGPIDVVRALAADAPLLAANGLVTAGEALLGLALGIGLGFLFAVGMDAWDWLYRAAYPLLTVTQTVPPVAIAPLLVLWFGYGVAPKVVLVVVVTFFPVTVGLLDGYRAVDPDAVALLRSMGAGRLRVFRYIKFPAALPQFFSGVRLAAAYAVVAAVVSEWMGGFSGLGVYMTRVKAAYAFDRMFAVILLISALSLLLMGLARLVQRRCMPYAYLRENETNGMEKK